MKGATRQGSKAKVIDVTGDLLRRWPLPMPSAEGDKEERGRVLVIAGSREMPGAVILSATAALRAGAGKLAIATGRSVAPLVAQAVPEARVIAVDEAADGGLTYERVDQLAGNYDAVLIGPGMQGEAAACELVRRALSQLQDSSLILDAAAMDIVREKSPSGHSEVRPFASPVLLTPHAGELAHLLDIDKAAVQEDPCEAAVEAARRWNATVALKGARTYIATASGTVWRHEGGNVGLAISGSGDILAGIITALAARGASIAQAAVWGVALHARAGDALAVRVGPLGYLAREIAAEIPGLMAAASVSG
jgi:ADP-dependent NAD(P)H-hydrate dehydratase